MLQEDTRREIGIRPRKDNIVGVPKTYCFSQKIVIEKREPNRAIAILIAVKKLLIFSFSFFIS